MNLNQEESRNRKGNRKGTGQSQNQDRDREKANRKAENPNLIRKERRNVRKHFIQKMTHFVINLIGLDSRKVESSIGSCGSSGSDFASSFQEKAPTETFQPQIQREELGNQQINKVESS